MSQSSKAALEEIVGAGGNFGNSEEIFGRNLGRKGLNFLVFIVDNKIFQRKFLECEGPRDILYIYNIL